MNKIKVIKKVAVVELDNRVNAIEEKRPLKSNGRDAIKTVESWIADWRARTESETRRAFAELTSLKLRNSNPT
jgi:hypothetical protein